MTNSWRLILDGPVDAAKNMARDRAVQLARERGDVPPTLRLYRWTRPTVTLGRFQPADSVDHAYCRANGIDVVRRFTGGRGVLHVDELTYAVVASVEDGVPRGVAASYRHLCQALVRSFEGLGVPASLTPHDRKATSSAACYLASTRADLSVGVAKLSGSAQVWKGATVLQHGSFVRTRDIERERRAFRLSDDEAASLARDAVVLGDLLEVAPSDERIATAVASGFSDALGIGLEVGELTEGEHVLEQELLDETDPFREYVRGT